MALTLTLQSKADKGKKTVLNDDSFGRKEAFVLTIG